MLLSLMCLRTKKVLFTFGLGMTMMIYLSASNFEKFNVVSILGP